MPELKSRGGRPSIWFETKGDPSNPAVVLLHGFTGTHRTWDKLSERLAVGRFVILPDLPGHGDSGVSISKAEMGVGPTSDAVAEVIKDAAATRKGERVALLGYSLGGRVALDLACKRQELLSCLILEGASPGIERDEERESRRAADDALADEVERRGLEWFVDYWQGTPAFESQRALAPAAFGGQRRDRLSNSAHGLAMSLRSSGPGEMVPLWGSLDKLKIPVLFVVGGGDTKYLDIAEALRRKIRGSVVAKVAGAGHCVHLEKPEEFADVVGQFLEGHVPIPRPREGEPET